ncbi:hypothetical protein MKS88_003948 [Plasmodium brasilianum]|uniref:Uncharacterized protein n=2 Tax=Plasmodium (Plasmodium) TaxID=418103 RepID=A0A1A8WW82_PLAMA|nr:hypothetical protein MKS88_003948 [Plasmodium brasilianum]SBS97235.1 Plasmodium exported protein, unknown function [Plasmodium malariae]
MSSFVYTCKKYGSNEDSVGKALNSKNIRILCEPGRDFSGSHYSNGPHDQNLYGSTDSINEKRDNNRDGTKPPPPSPQGSWSTFNDEGLANERLQRNPWIYDYYQNNVRYVAPENNINHELIEKLKKNAIYILPVLLVSYYLFRNSGTQTFLLIAAIAGVLMYTRHYIN